MQQGHGDGRLESRVFENRIQPSELVALQDHRRALLRGTAAGALPQAEALVIDCIRARADRDQNLVRFVPACDQSGRAADQVYGLAEQLIDKLAGVGLGREAPRQTQQRFAAAVQDSNPLGGNQACLDVDETERLGQIVVGAGLHARDAVVGVAERREQDEIRIRRAGPGTRRQNWTPSR